MLVGMSDYKKPKSLMNRDFSAFLSAKFKQNEFDYGIRIKRILGE